MSAFDFTLRVRVLPIVLILAAILLSTFTCGFGFGFVRPPALAEGDLEAGEALQLLESDFIANVDINGEGEGGLDEGGAWIHGIKTGRPDLA